jgi:class 3 adenylate cyclase
MNASVLRSLRHRSFALLWSGQTISRLGDFLYEIALAWWVLEKTGSATLSGLATPKHAQNSGRGLNLPPPGRIIKAGFSM